jgi:hypothetical protein
LTSTTPFKAPARDLHLKIFVAAGLKPLNPTQASIVKCNSFPQTLAWTIAYHQFCTNPLHGSYNLNYLLESISSYEKGCVATASSSGSGNRG